MRLIRAGGLLLSIAWCSCSAATAPDEHDTNRISEEAISAFFADRLAGKTATFAGEKTMNLCRRKTNRLEAFVGNVVGALGITRKPGT